MSMIVQPKGEPSWPHPCQPPGTEPKGKSAYRRIIHAQPHQHGALWQCECRQHWHCVCDTPYSAWWWPITPKRARRIVRKSRRRKVEHNMKAATTNATPAAPPVTEAPAGAPSMFYDGIGDNPRDGLPRKRFWQ